MAEAGSTGDGELTLGPAPSEALLSHFPDRVHALVWRNWHAAEPESIAASLGTSIENVTAIAESMGLPPAVAIPQQQNDPGYFWMSMCRRNWHVASTEQLSALLGATPQELGHHIRSEDIGNWAALGGFKPDCAPLVYADPAPEVRQRTGEVKRIVNKYFGEDLGEAGEARFSFEKRLSTPIAGWKRPEDRGGRLLSPRIICTYLKVFGDPLLDPELAFYPQGLLERLSDMDIDSVWLGSMLHQLAPGGSDFPEFGDGHEQRLSNLRKLVARAGRCGIDVYLYLNEPRAMPVAFFDKRPQMAGVREKDRVAMCTSDERVRQWMEDALAHTMSQVPGLGGVFVITASENLTNCWTRGRGSECPRCGQRDEEQVIAEAITTIERGVHRGNPDAKVIAWDWGWASHGRSPGLVARLPKSVWLMSVSEWSLPIERGGVKSQVGEYSISAVGPGPRAFEHWGAAKQAGMKTMAKMQLNTTWEAGSLPYLPVLDLVAEHCHNVAQSGVEGMLFSWSVGGYPSPNVKLANRFSRAPLPTVDEALDDIALDWFGAQGEAHGRRAWSAFSKAFAEFPYHIDVLYWAPVQLGPANLCYPTATNMRATMVAFPFDDVKSWRGPYPADVLAKQFEKVARGWAEGIPELEQATAKAPAEKRAQADMELTIARAAGLYFRSTANQIRFTLLRDRLADTEQPPAAAERDEQLDEICRVLTDEIEAARQMYAVAKSNSTIGYETAGQYYFLPLDLVEKVVSCELLRERYAAQRDEGQCD